MDSSAAIAIVSVWTVFVSLTVIILAPLILRSIDRARLLQSLHKAFEAGHELPPELIEIITQGARPSPIRDLRIAIVLLCIAAGFVVLAFCINQVDGPGSGGALFPLLGVAAFPGFIGVGFMGLYLAQK